MSSFLCFICHSTVNSETSEEVREKYREVIGLHLCPDSHLCYICCHILNKLSLFKSVCLKRSLEYPVLFSEKGTLYLQRNDLEIHVLCPEECDVYQQNRKSFHFIHSNDLSNSIDSDNHYVKLEDDEYFENHEYYTQNANNDNGFNENNDHEIDLDEIDQIDLPKETENNYVINTINDNRNDIINYNENNDHEINQIVDQIVQTDTSKEILNNDIVNIINDNTDIINNIGEVIENHNNIINIEENADINKVDNAELIIEKKPKKSKKKDYKKIVLSVENQKIELEANRRKKKYLEAEFKCYNCALGFLFKDTYQTHMMRHEESNGEYQCQICTLRFATIALLRVHTTGHAERYKCTKCHSILKPRAKRSHACSSNKKVQNMACHLCGNLFRDANGLQQHLRRVHKSTRLISCTVCGERYSSQALRTHMIKHIRKKFHCDQCEAIFSSPYTLTQHKKVHNSRSEIHFCVTCGIGYDTRKSLLAHRRTSLNHQTTMLECSICNRACPGRRALELHLSRVHSNLAEHACTLCSARYTTSGGLARHMAGHSKIKKKMAVCHMCGNSYQSNYKLKRHLKEVCEKVKLEEELSALYE